MRSNLQWFMRGVRLLTALALILSVVPLGTVSAAPIEQLDALRTAEPSVGEASTGVEPIRAGRGSPDRVAAAPPVSAPQNAPQAPNAVNIVATKRDAVVNDVDGDGRADPGDTLRYTVVITNSGDTDAASVVFNDTIDDNTVLSGTLKSTPLARNDTYTAVGNVRISLAAGSGVLANDSDPDGGAISVVSSSATSVNGGNVAVNADGSFTYNPPPGFEGADTFTYTIQDADGNQDSATVTVTVSGMIWFINVAAAAGGDGRLTTPFNCLSGAGCFSAAADDAGDNIFVYENAAAYSGGITLLNNQKLIGQDATSSLAALAGVTPPSYSEPLPAMNTGAPAATLNGGTNAVTLAQNNALYGFTAGTATGASIGGSGFGTLLVNDVIINTTGASLGLSTGAFGSPATFTSITSSGGSNNVSLTGVTGTGNLGGGALSGASSHAFAVDGGTAILTYSGTVNNTAARSVSVINKTGGSVTLSGAVSGTAQGVFLNSNTGATIDFIGGLALSTGGNAAFTATGGGTVNVCDENPCNPAATGALVNTLSTTTGTALNVANTTIGANDLEFRSISANGAITGIVLNNTGASGNLAVKGNGGSCTSDGTCSGGAIQNTIGDGLALTSTNGVVLTRLFVGSTGNQGINTSAINGLTLTSSYVTNAGNSDNEHGLNLVNVQGTVTIDGTTFNGASEDLIHLENNNVNVTLNVINSSQFSHPASIGGFANSAILLLPGGTAAITALIQNSTFTNVKNAAAQIGANLAGSTGTQNFTFSNNTINITLLGRAGGVIVSGQESTITNITIDNNNFTGAGGNGVISIDTNDSAIVRGTASGNNISNPPGIGMFIAVDEAAKSDVTLNGNTITNSGGDGIQAVNFGGAGVSSMDMTMTNNQINGHSLNTGVSFVGGVSFTGFEDNSCVVLRSNTVINTPVNPTQCGGAPCVDYYLEEVGGTVTMEEVPNTGNTTVNAAYVNSINDPGPVTVFGMIDLTNGGTCNVTGLGMLPDGNQMLAQNQTEIDPGVRAPVVSAASNAMNIFALVQDLPVPSVGGNSKPLLSLPFNPAFTPQADRGVNLDRVEAPIAPLSIGTLPAGKTVTLTFEVVINNPMTPGVAQVSNQGTVSGGNFSSVLTNDPDTGAANDPTVTPLDINADIQLLSKSDGNISVTPGQQFGYTLVYTNAGPNSAANVTLTDTIPANTTYSGSGWTCPNNNAGAVCTINVGSVARNAGGSTVFTVTVINPIPAGVTQLSNSASIGTSVTDPAPGNNSASDTTPINAEPDLTLTKTDGGASVAPGGTVAYTLNYTNAGNQGATGVVLTETVPANTTFNAGASSVGWICTPNNSAGSICTLVVGSVNGGGTSGSRTFAVTVINPVAAGVTQISNTASVGDDGSNGADPNAGNNSSTDMTPLNAAPDLSVTKTDGGISTTPGGTVAYTLTYANVGNQDATGVVLTEIVPANTTYTGSGWTCSPDNNAGSTCTFAIGALNGGGANGSRTFTVTVVNPVAAGVNQISNTASVGDDGSNGADTNAGNNSSTDTTPLTAAPDLSITKNDGGISTTPGSTLVYTLTYSNSGNQGATGVVLNETVPVNAAFSAVASTAGWSCAPDDNAGSTCSLSVGAMSGGASGTATFAVIVASSVASGVTQISNTASVADDGSNGADSTPGNNSSTDTTPLDAAPDLQITKDDDGVTFLPGDNITYTIAYTNVGNQNAVGVVITDVVPANTTFVGSGWTCTPNNTAGSVCSRTVGGLNVGASGSATFIVQVDDPAPGVILISNSATISDDGSNGLDLNPGDNSDTELTSIANLAPTILSVNVAPGTINETGFVTVTGTFTDPDVLDAHTLVINWGDGSTNSAYNFAAGETTFTVTHQYLDDNPSGTPSDVNAIGLALSDNFGNSDTDSASVTVNNLAPTLSSMAVASPINENGIATLTGNIAEVSPQDIFTLTVTWGDGNTGTYVFPAGTTVITATHQYLDDDPSETVSDAYSVGMTLTDDDLGSDTASVSVAVNNVAPTLSNLNATTITENGSTTLIGNLVDVGTQDTFTLTVDWGDGNNNTFTYPAGTTAFTATHQYLDDKPSGTPSDSYSIGLTLTDDDTGGTTGTTTATVNNAAPTLSNVAVTPASINENGSATLNGNIADVGTQDTFTLTVAWGDGNSSVYTYPAGATAFTATHQYLDDNPSGTASDAYSIGVTLTDDDLGSDTASASVTVNNVAPTLSNLNATTITENGATMLTGNLSDVGTQDTFTLTVNWADGNTDTFTYPAGTTALTQTHQYLDDNPSGTASDAYSIGVTLTDDDLGSDTASASVTVNNAAPTLSNLTTTAISENDTTTLTGNITDVGTQDTFTLTVNWGDGASTQTFSYPAGTAAFTQTHQYLDDNPSGTPSDNYVIGLTLTDDDTGSTTANATVTVGNAAPTLSNLSATTITENGTSTLTGNLADVGTQDTFTLTVNWGDGNNSTYTYPAGTTAFTQTHQYLDDNPDGTPSDSYSIGLTLTDDDTGNTGGAATVTVNNAAPTLSNVVATSPITENGVATLTGNIADVGTQDAFTLTVTWGDGSATTFTYPAGTTAFTQTHQYLDDNPSGTISDTYPIGLMLTDDDTGSTTANTSVTVNNLAPVLSNVSVTSPISENGSATLTGNIADVGTQDTFTLTVTWGEGDTTAYSYSAGTTAFTATHQYLDDNPSGTSSDVYSIGLALTDDDTASVTATTSITVNNVAPTVNAGPDQTAVKHRPVTLAGAISDPGTLDTFAITWDFGDGLTTTGTLTPTHVYTSAGAFTVTLTVADDDGGVGSDQAVVKVGNPIIYLPLVARNYASGPDLIVTSLSASTGQAQVVIKNQGNEPLTDGFYVDLYVNPNPVPTLVNQVWSDGRSQRGVVWGVTSPLQPGQVLTLTIGDAYYLPDYSVFAGTLSVGTPIYAQVDSYNPFATYGAVLENHELGGLPYNNILGPVLSTANLTLPWMVNVPSRVGETALPIRVR